METVYLAGGCLWSVQEFIRYVPGVVATQAGRANGSTNSTKSDYDGYAECVKVDFSPEQTNAVQLLKALFEIIDPYSINQQGPDVGIKYRTGFYSQSNAHLQQAKAFIAQRSDAEKIALEVLLLINYIPSDDEHQFRLSRHPEDHCLCALPWELLHRYKSKN